MRCLSATFGKLRARAARRRNSRLVGDWPQVAKRSMAERKNEHEGDKHLLRGEEFVALLKLDLKTGGKPSTAMFWLNPEKGKGGAKVGIALGDDRKIEFSFKLLYNRCCGQLTARNINAVSLRCLLHSGVRGRNQCCVRYILKHGEHRRDGDKTGSADAIRCKKIRKVLIEIIWKWRH